MEKKNRKKRLSEIAEIYIKLAIGLMIALMIGFTILLIVLAIKDGQWWFVGLVSFILSVIVASWIADR